MIILGDRYTFTKTELSNLTEKSKNIVHISYKNISVTQSIQKIKEILENQEITLIILNTKVKLSNEFLTYLTKLEHQGIKYITIEHFLEQRLNKCYINLDESSSNSFLEDIHSYTFFQYFQKRLIDYTAIILLFPITFIAILYSYFRVQKESPGPLFFKQARVGYREKEFDCVKLRSMHLDAEKSGAMFATDDDPRTFPWGKTIRYNKIDELIQLWNVLKGEMHFVGPRPERKVWTNEFEKSIPYYSQRYVVAPGITGLAQIKYQYGAGKLDAYQKLMYDLYYIKHWSLFLELKIIWGTATFVLFRKKISNF